MNKRKAKELFISLEDGRHVVWFQTMKFQCVLYFIPLARLHTDAPVLP